MYSECMNYLVHLLYVAESNGWQQPWNLDATVSDCLLSLLLLPTYVSACETLVCGHRAVSREPLSSPTCGCGGKSAATTCANSPSFVALSPFLHSAASCPTTFLLLIEPGELSTEHCPPQGPRHSRINGSAKYSTVGPNLVSCRTCMH